MDQIKKCTESYLHASEAMNNKVELWVADIRFITDVLEKLNMGLIPSKFAHRLWLDQGISVFGQSYGGAASVLVCCLDERLTCAINMDGAMYGGMSSKYIYRRPTMYMESDMLPGRSRYFFSTNEHDTYHVTVKDSRHLDYSDFTYILKNWLLKSMLLLGRIDGSRMIKITNDYVQSFFDEHIRQIESSLFNEDRYPEVVFEKRRRG